jgi:hypothetical protein
MADLIIKGVDLELLEKQRKVLATIPRGIFHEQVVLVLDGLQNMLDSWSDERAEEEANG